MPLLLSLITLIFSVLPFTLGPSSPFFTIDQEVVYVTNALSYVVRKQIPFYDHPGTPGILLLSASFTPLRLWAKYFIHTPFIDWSIKNFTFLMYYSRFFVLIVYCAGLAILLRAVHNFTASRLAVILTSPNTGKFPAVFHGCLAVVIFTSGQSPYSGPPGIP